MAILRKTQRKILTYFDLLVSSVGCMSTVYRIFSKKVRHAPHLLHSNQAYLRMTNSVGRSQTFFSSFLWATMFVML